MTKKPRRKKPRQYTLDDLQAMVEQLGGRLHLAIWPKEMTLAEWQALQAERASTKDSQDSK